MPKDGECPMADDPRTLPFELLLAQADGAPERTSMLPVLLVGFGIMLAVFLLLRHQWRRTSRREARAAAAGTPSERIRSIRDQADASGSLHRTMAEATELSQRLAAELDNKAERLEQLLEEAEGVIERLERAERGHAGAPRGHDGAGEGAPAEESDPATRRIYALADEGLDPVEIARRLDQHLGKVQLILALRRA